MKKLFSMFALLLSLALILTGCGSVLIENLDTKNILGSQTTENDVTSTEYQLLLENDKIQFHMNPNTTEIKVVNKADNSVWTSSNPKKESDDGKALLHLEYTTSGGVTNQINSYEAAVTSGQYKINPEKDKVTVSYSIGNFTSQVLVPEILTKERYKELSDRFEDVFDAAKFRNYYTLFNKEEMPDDDVYAVDIVKKYPILEKEVLYVVSQTVITNATVKKDFAQLLSSIGYNKSDFESDSKNFANASNTVEEAGFNISVEFTLDGGDLVVNIPNDKIEMFTDFPLTKITLLKYFGSQTKEDTGYFLLPDGSGSIMNLYNGKTDGHAYTTRIYGTGYALSEGEKTNDYNNASLPVFGINSGENGIFAEIIKGESIADVVAYSGDGSEVAYAAPCFHFRETFISRLSSGRKEAFNTIQKQRFPGEMAIRYSFLTGEQCTYNGMADFYRNRLFGSNKNADKEISVVVEYLGMIQKQAQMFGIAYEDEITMTTFDDVAKYSKELKTAGINNLNVKLSGWFGSGYNHTTATKIKPVKDLGGIKGLTSLASTLNKEGISFWPDADVQYTADDSIGSDKKAIRTIDKHIGATYAFDLASFNKVYDIGSRRVNTFSVVKDELAGFVNFAKKNSLNSISLRTIGEGVNADFNEENFIDQQTAVDSTVKELKKLKDDGMSLMTSGANAYMFGLADMCLNVPLISNEYDSTDYSIPFLQMVIRGNVNYSGDAINLTGDTTSAVLSAAQTGANLYYVFAGENATEVVDSDFADFYSIDYSYYKDSVIEVVKKYQSDFADTAGQRISSYAQLQSGVTKTVFENGSISYVNINNFAVEADGVSIPAKSYIVKKG